MGSSKEKLTSSSYEDDDRVRASRRVKELALAAGFDLVGVAQAAAVDSRVLDAWIEEGHHGDMKWMESSREARLNPTALLPNARSVVALALNYYHEGTGKLADGARIARVAWGRDYHKVLGCRLRAFRRALHGEFRGCETYGGVDSVPIMEKLWAERAGLGWIGKNGLLITREYGSWVYLAVLMVTLELAPDAPISERCGSCTTCIETCPTGAIASPGVIDARRCIAYNTIESRGEWPREVTDECAGWLFGCDDCQSSCPWSIKRASVSTVQDFALRDELARLSLSDVLALDERDFDLLTRGSVLRRRGLERLKCSAELASRALAKI